MLNCTVSCCKAHKLRVIVLWLANIVKLKCTLIYVYLISCFYHKKQLHVSTYTFACLHKVIYIIIYSQMTDMIAVRLQLIPFHLILLTCLISSLRVIAKMYINFSNKNVVMAAILKSKCHPHHRTNLRWLHSQMFY